MSLKAGMIASITLGEGKQNAKVMVVPLTAVIRSPGQQRRICRVPDG